MKKFSTLFAALLCAGTMMAIEGALPGKFIVDCDGNCEIKVVQFSSGNLQYNATAGTHATVLEDAAIGVWRFAPHQWDTIGSANLNASETYDGWISLFNFGASGYGSMAPYAPANILYNVDPSYWDEGTHNYYFWGPYNAISNGGNEPGKWFNLDSHDWYRLFRRYPHAFGNIDGTNGLIILPEKWQLPEGLSFTAGYAAGYATNAYTVDDWAAMEAAGAVFLPAEGDRSKIDNLRGCYWSDYMESRYQAYYLCFWANEYGIGIKDPDESLAYQSKGYSVRLVTKMEPADLTDLQAAIDSAYTVYNAIRNDYPEIAAQLLNAIQQAVSVRRDYTTDQQDANNAITALETAIQTAQEEVTLQGIEHLCVDEDETRKIMMDGTVYIISNGTIYDLHGTTVR